MSDVLSCKCKSAYAKYLCSLKMKIVSSPGLCYLFSIPARVAAGQLILVSRAMW